MKHDAGDEGMAPKVDPAIIPEWVLFEDDDYLALDKPGWLVCHPSKDGPWSSLVGACREFYGMKEVHLVSRLDRETSGVVLLAKNKKASSLAQKAVQERRLRRSYVALLEGELSETLTAEGWLGNDPDSAVFVKQRVTARSAKAKKAFTRLEPLLVSQGYTLASIRPKTGRKHQIRVHAQFLGYPLVGEKLYGRDENYYLEFVTKGWTAHLQEQLPINRQALHAASLVLEVGGDRLAFNSPFPLDLKGFCNRSMSLSATAVEEAYALALDQGSTFDAKRIGKEGRVV